jgi:hypothetical protein
MTEEKSGIVLPKDNPMVKLFRSFSNRWGIMLPILEKALFSGTKSIADNARAQAKLISAHMKAARELPGLSEDERNALAAETSTQDGESLEEFIRWAHLTPTPDVPILLARAREKMQEKIDASKEENKPKFSDEEAQERLRLDSVVPDSVVPESSEQRDLFHAIAFGLGLAYLRSGRAFNPNFTYIDEDLAEKIAAFGPTLSRKEVASLVGYMKLVAGSHFVFDDSDDIPF